MSATLTLQASSAEPTAGTCCARRDYDTAEDRTSCVHCVSQRNSESKASEAALTQPRAAAALLPL